MPPTSCPTREWHRPGGGRWSRPPPSYECETGTGLKLLTETDDGIVIERAFEKRSFGTTSFLSRSFSSRFSFFPPATKVDRVPRRRWPIAACSWHTGERASSQNTVRPGIAALERRADRCDKCWRTQRITQGPTRIDIYEPQRQPRLFPRQPERPVELSVTECAVLDTKCSR